MNTQDRVSRALAEADDPAAFKTYSQFVYGKDVPEEVQNFSLMYQWAHDNGMILAGRPNSALGTTIKATLINCFVQPIRDTSLGEGPDGKPGIMPALAQAFETLRRGGGVGYNFSHIRPKGARVNSTNSTSSGPVSYMELYGQSCATVESAGQRRGAQMAILDCNHPDIQQFIHCKDDIKAEADQKKPLAKFNISVNVFDALVEAAKNGLDWELFHEAEPHPEFHPDAYRRDDGMWVYKVVSAKELMDDIIGAVYNGHGEPGVFYGDNVNNGNPLNYAEHINCSNPCAEQSLPDYGCCDLGQVNLTALVRNPFTDEACFDFATFAQVVKILQRGLDNILDLTLWPLPEQLKESRNKRRVGVGFLGIGSALPMLGLKYDSDEGRDMAEKITKAMATACYEASIELAKERGSFPLLDREKHVQAPIVQRLPEHIRTGILDHGLRNSHSLSIAPTGTIALAFADNASNGIEPPFSWIYSRRVLDKHGMPKIKGNVQDYAFRLWRHLGCPGADRAEVESIMDEINAIQAEFSSREFDSEEEAKAAADEVSSQLGGLAFKVCALLPDSFRSSFDISVQDHLAMMSVVQPYIDASISKTVNVPMDYPWEDFREMYFTAHAMGLKSVAAFKPQPGGASVLIGASEDSKDAPPKTDDPDRLMRLDKPRATESAILHTSRPASDEGHEGITYDLRAGQERVFVTVNKTADGIPFEVLTQGGEGPRGITALAKLLSLDMHSTDRGWVLYKLDSLAKTNGGPAVQVSLSGQKTLAPSMTAAMAMLIREHYQRMGIAPALDTGPLLDARLCLKEPKSAEGGTARSFDVVNPASGDDFTFFVKEFDIDGFGRWPLSIWLSGKYPRSWDGIAKMLSLDMRIADPAWIGRKLRAMLNVTEHDMSFWAKVPGREKPETLPSTLAYVAEILIYRYNQLGLLSESGYPIGIEEKVDDAVKSIINKGGAACPSCGNHTLVKRDGCEVCDTCGYMGSCG
jgi:ribonucleoside-diphosphate reductase alpha chain